MSTNLSPSEVIARQLIDERVYAASRRAEARAVRRAARAARREARRSAPAQVHDVPLPAFRFLHPVH
ncbi:MAG: hypothetical protein QM747_08005 [Nocardioides sp.]